MRRVLTIAGVAALLGPLALLGACIGEVGSAAGSGSVTVPPIASGTPSGSETPAGVRASPSATFRSVNGAPVVGSGMKLVGVPTVGDGGYDWRYQIAADGAGMVWFLGPWQLVRLDPSAAEVTTWDAEDDRRFAAPGARLAAAAGPGVWLLDEGRVRLFDGKRFVVDEQLPADVLNVPGGPPGDGFVYDLVQVGGDVWVSVVDSMESEEDPEPVPGSGGRVARFADDEWTVMSQPGDLVGGDLTVDAEGAVWDGGQMWSDDVGSLDMARGAKPKRWDGHAWTSPGGATAPDKGGAVVADPTGGVWLLVARAQGAARLRYFDGTTWRSMAGLPPSNEDGGEPGMGGLAVDQDGWAWLLGARVSHTGQVEALDSPWLAAIAAAGNQVVAVDFEQGLLWTGDRFVPVTDRSGTADWFYEELPLAAALSADEVVVSAEDTLYRLADGEWEDTQAGSTCLARASDGAVWSTGDKLFRTTTVGSRAVTKRPAVCGYEGSIFAGPQGSVWVIQDDEVVQVWPDGRRTSIGRPERVDPDLGPEYDQDQVCLHGVDPDGAVWVTEYSDEDDEECEAGTWHRWDGRTWHSAEEPDPFTSAPEKVVSGDGVGWTLTGSQITRYSNGRANVVAEESGLTSLTAAPDSVACALAYPRDDFHATAIVCYDAQGETARSDVTGMGVEDFSIAPDGAIWIVGPQVARLGHSVTPSEEGF